MKNDTGLRLVDMRVDGGMTVNNLLMQIQVRNYSGSQSDSL